MSEADILALTYEDTVTVRRAYKDILPNGESIFKKAPEGKVIYENEACALSTHNGGKLEQSNSTARADTSFCLFTRPEIDIRPNDFLVVMHLGKRIEAVAGFPDRMSSHNNIPIRMADDVV